MTKHCQFYFAGIPSEAGTFPLQAGVEPSTGQLSFTISNGSRLPQIGDVTITDGAGSARVFRNCRIVRSIRSTGTSGQMYEVTFVDRRWLWASDHYAVSGEYNRNETDYPNNRTPRQLAVILAQFMGESGFDVSAFPHAVAFRTPKTKQLRIKFFQGPLKKWDADNPASELDTLCQEYGMIPSLSTSDRLVVHPIGSGRQPFSDQRLIENTNGIEPPVIPRSLVFEGGQTSIQHDLKLVPVGKEVTGDKAGQFIDIDDLSYKPSIGWERDDPNTFLTVLREHGRRAQRLAQEHIWTLYAVGDGFQLPLPPFVLANKNKKGGLTTQQVQQIKQDFKINAGTSKVQSERWRILPVNAQQNFTYQQEPAEVIGYFNLANSTQRNVTNIADYASLPADATNYDKLIATMPLPDNSKLHYTDGFTLNQTFGFVKFNRPVYFVEQGVGLRPAVIRLRTSFPLRFRDTAAVLCQQFWQSPGSPQAVNVATMVKRSDIWYEYDTQGNNNQTEFTAAAFDSLLSRLNQYKIGVGVSQTFRGFAFDYMPDGIVRTVTFAKAYQGGGTTSVDFNMERPDLYTTLAEIRNRRALSYQARKVLEDQRKRARGLLR